MSRFTDGYILGIDHAKDFVIALELKVKHKNGTHIEKESLLRVLKALSESLDGCKSDILEDNIQ